MRTFGTRARRAGSTTVCTLLVATLLQVPVSPARAEGGPSVPLPPTSSVPVAPQTVAPRPPDQAWASVLRGDQPASNPPDGGGTSKATSLAPSATWDVSEHTGDFSWSYPLRVPPAPGGLQPNLALSYRSSAVDGRTSATNNQPSWVGDGWELWPGYIERTYGSCASDTEGGITPPQTGDLCWRSDNATASFAGGGGILIRDDATGVWRPKNDDGSRVERFTGAGTGDLDGEHWRITKVDGTQYWFGSQPGSNSTWTVPVFGDDVGEPCHGGTFDTSHCVQGWRWNLDKVIDRHGNTLRYFYDTESNNYGFNMKDPAVSYIRAGTLNRIEYGLRDDLPNNPATGRVLFVTTDRCVRDSVCALDRKPNWPDTPLDDRCDTPTCPDRHSPTFWSTKRLSSVTTQVWRGAAYADVDRWTLGQEFPDPGDGEKAALWLRTVVHTGLVGGSIDLPAVTFEGSKMANRVDHHDGVGPLNRYRITGVVSEAGGFTSVIYAPPECRTGGPLPTNPESNNLRCFPQRWTKKDWAERTDHFHKYVVAQIVQSDRLSTSTAQVTSYEYLDGVAWHFDTSEFVKEDKKTWNEFRGFGRVRVRGGRSDEVDPAGPRTLVEHRFHRGMDGDKLPSGTRSVTVTDSEGGVRTDSDWLEGFGFESTTFNGEGGPVVTKSLTEPFWQGPTATRGALKAYLVRPGVQRTLTALSEGGWRTTRTETSYDDRGLPTQANDLGDTATATDDRCVRTTYVRNEDRWLLTYPSRVETIAVHCGQAPTFPDHAISDVRGSYDQQAPGVAPTAGNLTRIEVAGIRPASGPVYDTVGTSKFDVHGRVIESTDALGNTSRTSYAPSVGGPVTQTVGTSSPTPAVPAGLVTTTTVEPAWGKPTVLIDPNGRRSDVAYDALGRSVEVWLPNRKRADGKTSNLQFAYAVRNDGINVVTTKTIGPNGNYTTSAELFDGFLRKRQIQAPAVNGGRLLSDIRYDSHGRVFKVTQPYFNNSSVDGTLVLPSEVDVPGLTQTEFDGAGRPVISIFKGGGIEKWRTSTSYGGDRVTVIPPAGGTTTTTISDARAQMVELRQHGSSGFAATHYAYTPAGKLAQVTDPAGNTWRYVYDLRGRKTSETDPDKGATIYTYDNADQLTSTTDSRNATLAYTYDSLGRKTGTYLGSTAGTKLAEWVHDTAISGKGQLASTTRYVNGNAYSTSVYSYTSLYLPTEITVSIPAVEGALSGNYSWYGSYGWDGSLSGEAYPGAGGLPAETVNYVSNDLGLPISSSGAYNGTVELVHPADYTRYGELQRLELGKTPKRAWLSFYYEDHTRRLSRSIVDAEVPRPMQADLNYTYDPAGNITSIADKPLDQTADVQCFRYDQLRRLKDAWTPTLATWSETSGCRNTPTDVGLTGPTPYWHSYDYDQVGNRLTEVQHATSGDVTRTYGYPAAGGAQPHALSSVTTTRPGQAATSDTYNYDLTGNTRTRTRAGVDEALTWDAEGHLASVTKSGQTTSFIYTADGQRLLRKDPTGTTLYLDRQEVRLATGSSTPAATRYYTFNGHTIAARQGATLTWLGSDHQATQQIAINTDTLQVTLRRHTPFGAPRGNPSATWPGEKGFVGGTIDPSTELTHLGAREYDPATGRFLSVDPIIDLADPQQWNGYAYSNNNPVTFSDPTGLKYFVDEHTSVDSGAYRGDTNAGGAPAPVVKHSSKNVVVVHDPVAKKNWVNFVQLPDEVDVDKTAAALTEFLLNERNWRTYVRSWSNPDEPLLADYFVANLLTATCAKYDCGGGREAHYKLMQIYWASGGAQIGPQGGASGGGRAGGGPARPSGMGHVHGVARPVSVPTHVRAKVCSSNSFVPNTPVLMADGSHKPIKDVRVGDKVLGTDPYTGETGPHDVIATITGHGDKELVTIEINTNGDGTGVIIATGGHPVWVDNQHRWIEAGQLEYGDNLVTPTGDRHTVIGARKYHEPQTVHNLTVDRVHAYYVHTSGSGSGTDVLVHNCNTGEGLVYEGSPKHGSSAYGTSRGVSNPEPANGQAALTTSVQVRGTSPRRVGVDREAGQIVVFDETHPGQGIYHGHVRAWAELTQQMQNALVRAGLADRRGKVLPCSCPS